jgi:hypothetical protein
MQIFLQMMFGHARPDSMDGRLYSVCPVFLSGGAYCFTRTLYRHSFSGCRKLYLILQDNPAHAAHWRIRGLPISLRPS